MRPSHEGISAKPSLKESGDLTQTTLSKPIDACGRAQTLLTVGLTYATCICALTSGNDRANDGQQSVVVAIVGGKLAARSSLGRRARPA